MRKMRSMKSSKFLLIMLLFVFVFSTIAGCGNGDSPTGADGERPDELTFDDADTEWTMQSIWVPSITLWRGDKYFVDLINRQALGDLYIDFNEGGSLVSDADELFDAVRTGTVDMASDWPSYWEGRDEAFGLVTSTPMVLTPGDYMLWYWQAGGLELIQDLYAEYGLVWFPHSVTSPESGQRTNVPINDAEDFDGQRLRQCGRRQSDILEDMGAGAIFMGGADIYLALDRGTIDGAEFSVPEVDWSMGLQEVTDYLVVPGWHQPGPVSGIMVNEDSWNDLPDRVKYLFKEAAMASMMWSWTYYEYSTIDYHQRFIDDGMEVTRIDDETLEEIQEIAWEYLIEDARDNPTHAKIAFSQVKYLYEFQEWREAQEPFMFGRNPSGLDETYEELREIAQDHGVYDEVIELEASVRERMEEGQHWEPGTTFEGSPILQ